MKLIQKAKLVDHVRISRRFSLTEPKNILKNDRLCVISNQFFRGLSGAVKQIVTFMVEESVMLRLRIVNCEADLLFVIFPLAYALNINSIKKLACIILQSLLIILAMSQTNLLLLVLAILLVKLLQSLLV